MNTANTASTITISTEDLKRIRILDDATLIIEINVSIARIATDVSLLAALIQEAARRQCDRTSEVCKSGIWVYLPLVASGAVSARATATFCSRERLLALVRSTH